LICMVYKMWSLRCPLPGDWVCSYGRREKGRAISGNAALFTAV